MKKIKLLMPFISFIIVFLLNNSFVYADSDYVEGPKHGVNDCSKGGGCFKGTIGFRVTIVNKNNGERCYYDPEKKEVCVDKSKYSKAGLKKLKESKSIDLWFNAKELNILSSDQCYAVTGQRTKIEYINSKKTVPYDKCKNVYPKAYSMTYLNFPAVSSSSYPLAWKSSGTSGNIGPANTASNMTSIVVWMLCKEYGTKTVSLGEKSYACKDQNKKAIEKDLTIFSNLFSYSFYKNKTSIDVKNVTNLDNVRIEFDQLLEILDANTSWHTKAHIGLVSEATKLYKNHASLINDSRGNGCINSSLKHSSCSSYFSSGGYLTGWRGSEKLGKLKAIDQDVFNKWSTSGVDYDNFSGSNTANVFTYWLHQDNTNPNICETVAPNINGETFAQYYTNLSKDKRLSTAEKEQITWMKNADYYGFKNVSELKKWAKNSCAKPSCEESYALHKKNKISGFNDKIPTLASSAEKKKLTDKDGRWNYKVKSIISAFSLGTSNANICKVSTCEEILNNLSLKNKYNTLNSTKKDYIEMIDTHKELFGGYNYKYLNKTILNEMKIVIPACEGKLPKCNNVDNITSCTSPFDIKVGKDASSDSSYRDNCILGGFLYNKGSNYYSSLNDTYTGFLENSKQYKVYCSEKIDIDMPQINSGYLKAGRVFQWGKDIDQNTNTGLNSDKKTFATMTVTHQCYKGFATPNGKNFPFSDDEINKFKNSNSHKSNTSIAFSYTDPLKKFPSLNNISYERIFESKNTSASRNMIQMKYVYNFVYGKSLTWYSHKGTEEKDLIDKNKYNTLSEQGKNEYLFIGYGAPTSYNTPDGTYKEIVKASIKNIGETGKYDHLYTGDTLEYKCDFKVHNEIIGNECCDTTTGKPFPGAPAYCTCDGGEEPKGLDVAFRTIQLVNKNASSSSINSEINKAFPGRTGAGRNLTGNIGKNWKTLIDSDTKTVLNILRDDIYSGAPQYTISLDVGKISAIRESNKALRDKSIDPYTYRGKVKNGTGYTCYENGKYGYCRSEFVKEYLEGKCATRSGTLETKPCE